MKKAAPYKPSNFRLNMIIDITRFFKWLLKKIFLTTLVLTGFVNSYGQICDSLIIKEVDKFTDKVTYRTKNEIFKYDGKYIRFYMTLGIGETGNYYLYFLVKERGFGCTDENDGIFFLFTDGTKQQFKNSSSFDCSGSSMIMINKFHKDNKVLEDLLKSKTISAIKIKSRSSSYSTDLNKEEAEEFRKGAECILNFEVK